MGLAILHPGDCVRGFPSEALRRSGLPAPLAPPSGAGWLGSHAPIHQTQKD